MHIVIGVYCGKRMIYGIFKWKWQAEDFMLIMIRESNTRHQSMWIENAKDILGE